MADNPREAIASDIWSETLKGSYSNFKVKIFEPKGEFGWHTHETLDELFVAIEGEFIIRLKDRDILMKKGDSFLIPRNVEHTTVSMKKSTAVVIRSSE
jgi:mannose-6-phosphate isomerase-like protein (cupin superfamily)